MKHSAVGNNHLQNGKKKVNVTTERSNNEFDFILFFFNEDCFSTSRIRYKSSVIF